VCGTSARQRAETQLSDHNQSASRRYKNVIDENHVLTTKATPRKAIGSQRASCVDRIRIHEEGEHPTEDKHGSADSKRLAAFVQPHAHIYASCASQTGIDMGSLNLAGLKSGGGERTGFKSEIEAGFNAGTARVRRHLRSSISH
jgi:hypothetical protein